MQICPENVVIFLNLNQFTSSCRLEELFLCLNGYNTVSESQTSCPSLRLLQITDNQLQEWAEVRKFGQMYPSLRTLVLANNSVGSVGDTRDGLQQLFPNLRSINLNNSGLRGDGEGCAHFHLTMFSIQNSTHLFTNVLLFAKQSQPVLCAYAI